MQPLNKAERRKAFTTFLIMFAATTALIIVLVFYSVRVPGKELAQLRDEVSIVEKERSLTDSFTLVMSETMNLLDSVNRPDVKNQVLIDAHITSNLKKLYSMVDNDLVKQKPLLLSSVKNMEELQRAKQGMRETSDKDATITELKDQLRKYQQTLSEYDSN